MTSTNLLTTTDYQAEAERLRQVIASLERVNQDAIAFAMDAAQKALQRATTMRATMDRLGLPEEAPPSVSFQEFGVSDVLTAMVTLIPGFGLAGCAWKVQNDTWWVPTVEDWDTVMAWDRTERLLYVPKRFNCTGFALALQSHIRQLYMSNCVGVVIDEGLADVGLTNHQYNVTLVTVNGKLTARLVEPQDGTWVEKAGLYQVTPRSMVLL